MVFVKKLHIIAYTPVEQTLTCFIGQVMVQQIVPGKYSFRIGVYYEHGFLKCIQHDSVCSLLTNAVDGKQFSPDYGKGFPSHDLHASPIFLDEKADEVF